MSDEIRIIETDDGSHSLYNPEIRETYHSTHGAIQESEHVFIRNGLAEVPEKQISILEIGLGTGLNVLLAALYAEENDKMIEVTSIEAYPLSEEIAGALNYGKIIDHEKAADMMTSIHKQPWETALALSAHCTLKKIRADWEQFQPGSEHYHLVFYDAYAPSKQPQMWSKELIAKTAEALRPGGIFVTYSARGQLKRDLKE